MELEFGRPEIEGVDIKEISCKKALSESMLEADYSLNPYRGCSHGCRYCYSPFVIKEERPWGEFLDVKRNIPKVVSEESKRKEKGMVRIGSVTDPYQEAESEYKLTRKCLKQLQRNDFPVLIQTKSDLVKRDVDLLKEMEADVGFTITSLDDDFRKRFEPAAPPVGDRLSAVRGLKEEGIDVWAFIGPLFPYENDGEEELARLKETLNSLGVEEIYLDKLNMRDGLWDKIQPLLEDGLEEKYKAIYFEGDDYFARKRGSYEEIGKPVF
ncbi:MAG: radical SAM protein [Candidatus Aenigmatarchaeota archaeon]